MKVLIVGSGGREHAIAWKLGKNKNIEKIYCAPGNGGTALEEKCENINKTSIEDLVGFAKENKIDLTVVGPEVPLIEGIVDQFKKEGLKIFGPDSKAALLEGSKIYSKKFMNKYGIPTAKYEEFEDYDKAYNYLKTCEYPVVIKADGLAAGKGVVICKDYDEGVSTIKSFMIEDIFKGSGKKIIVEEFLEGVEASILSITDGNTIIPFISAKDHKQILDGSRGPNTGGMGVIAPNPYVTEEVLKQFDKSILKPTLQGIKEEHMDYKGFIFFGIMITAKGVYLLEYNVRMGDPETQAVLTLMQSDLYEIMESTLKGELINEKVLWKNKKACAVVMASSGYPGSYSKGFKIGLDENIEGKVFIAGAELKGSELITSGGRVLTLVTLGETIEDARKSCYEEINKIKFENRYYRRDIGIAK